MKKLAIIVPVLAVFVLAGAGCQKKAVIDGESPRGDDVAMMDAEKMGGGDGDHFAQLFAQFKNFSTIDFRADMTFSGGENDGTTMVLKRDAPDTHHMIITSPRDGTSEMIYANSKNYVKGPGESTWLAMPSISIPDVVEMYTTDEKLEENVGKPEEAQYHGKKPCGVLMCHVYKTTVENGTSVIAFDTKDFLMRHVVFTGTSGDVVDINYTYEDVDVAIPSDVQEIELPAGLTQEDIQQMMEQAGR